MAGKSKKVRSLTCGIVAFLLSLALTLLCVLLVFRITVLNPNHCEKIISKSGYASHLHAELKEQFISYGSACNIDASFFDTVFETVVTEKQITEYTKSSIINFYTNTGFETSTKELEEQLLEQLKKYATDKGYDLDGTLTENLEVMSREMCELYEVYVGLFNSSYFRTASGMLARYLPLYKWAMAGLALFAFFAALIIRLSFSRMRNYLRYYIYASSGATLMLAVGPAIALIMKIGSRINVSDASLYYFVSGFINSIFITMLITALAMAMLTALLIIARQIRIKKHSHRHKQSE